MFEKREGRLREERDAARQQVEVALRERDATEHRVKDIEDQLEVQSRDLKVNTKEIYLSEIESLVAQFIPSEVVVATQRFDVIPS